MRNKHSFIAVMACSALLLGGCGGPSEAAQAAKVVSSDFEDFILSTGNVDRTINDDNDFVSKRTTLLEKVASELETYADALELYEKSLKALTEQL